MSCQYVKHFLSYHSHKYTPLKTCFWSCDFSDWLKCHDTIFRNFSRAMHICSKFEENLPSGCQTIIIKATENALAGRASRATFSPLSPKYK